ncbi:hypothetical protein HDF15_002018 [Granulicella mallensis]|uniref:Uncharacterized protein n=1 Tax=Granulicella mallensis TaxID=940614 RepID=A0A7W7ZQ04_9BACT|nr:hypothetical protein [Granulicella mallensis]
MEVHMLSHVGFCILVALIVSGAFHRIHGHKKAPCCLRASNLAPNSASERGIVIGLDKETEAGQDDAILRNALQNISDAAGCS